MDHFFNEEQIIIRDLCRQIAEEYIKPIRAEFDKKEEFPKNILITLAKADLFGLIIPKKYDGIGGGCLEKCIAIEELSRACLGISTSYAASFLGAYPIILFGSDEQKAKYLPQIAKGEKLAAFGLTESTAGSDIGAITTRAKRIDNQYILTGAKQWITNGGVASIYTIIANTNPLKGTRGLSAFIIEDGDPGFFYGKQEKKMGIRASITSELIFQDCCIPKNRLISREGMGFIITTHTLDKARLGVGAQSVGIAQGALDEAITFARTRKQFNKSIISFQAISHMLADMATKIEAARSLVYAAARYIDSNHKKNNKITAMAKLFASDIAMEVTTNAVQILGGHGYMREYPVEKMMRDAKILQIYEGTNQIQRNLISQALNKEYLTIKNL